MVRPQGLRLGRLRAARARQSGIPAADEIFHLVALTIVLSILLHSSTDVLVARAFDDERGNPGLARHAAPQRPQRFPAGFWLTTVFQPP